MSKYPLEDNAEVVCQGAGTVLSLLKKMVGSV